MIYTMSVMNTKVGKKMTWLITSDFNEIKNQMRVIDLARKSTGNDIRVYLTAKVGA